MRTFDFPALAERLLPSVLTAGAAQMRLYESGTAVEEKADSSPVTAADREAEAILLDGLWTAARGIPVVAEESMSLGVAPPRGTTFFLVDPLDGTREFVERRGEFTINVGLVVGKTPVFGLIYAPVLGALYVTLGKGKAVEAYIPPGRTDVSLSDCPLRELKTRTPNIDALTVLESRSHRTTQIEAFLADYSIAEVKRAGSSLKFCLIARGDADFYVRLGPTREWDTASGQAILEAAGGCVTTLAGHPLVYGNGEDSYYNPNFIAWGRTPIAPRRQ
ncbi:3'(2'),5'-bisphosphate nucleotidase CysQ [Hyphomicrobium sp. LHD-15]|uniref:3'(2'),5'-bisphosphate nucleotidase CysQ n=1 Tax=Hyphomicrobium sp. LHD-15 TaxID=3072142 RepID=UPI00280F97C7|nr:3'(2'),5'-bisphosphate nucleotidase CysQ [Hyphomicrobium sp. LHD-15]MDQ8697911.1 3'(2'),5'-bisphosphate nucleotidase CysQ [Hyphomicrobium sp. LHD-15]